MDEGRVDGLTVWEGASFDGGVETSDEKMAALGELCLYSLPLRPANTIHKQGKSSEDSIREQAKERC